MVQVQIEDVQAFWDSAPCGSALSSRSARREYFSEIESRRYLLEPHVPLVARFPHFRGRDVLEIGCGIGTDGLQFAREGARYVGIDLSSASIHLARERFSLWGETAGLAVVNAEELPFTNNSFDHVFSFGVIHHSPSPRAIAHEIHRVLRPGGTLSVMVYNRSSINYQVEIMVLRKVFRQLLRPSFMPRVLATIGRIDEEKLKGHRRLLLSRQRLTREQWVSMNTDGPDCPLSRVYSQSEALQLFDMFPERTTDVWYFDARHWPVLGALLPKGWSDKLGRRWGWHRMIYAQKRA